MRAWFLVACLVVGMVACSAAFASGPPAGGGWVQCPGNVCVGPAEEGATYVVVDYYRDACSSSEWFSGTQVSGEGDGINTSFDPHCWAPGDVYQADTGAKAWIRKLYAEPEDEEEPCGVECFAKVGITPAAVLYVWSWGVGAVLLMWSIGYGVGIASGLIRRA